MGGTPSIGGRTVGWDNTAPANDDSAGLGDDEFRSFKTSIQTLVDAEHEFSTTGGANSGRHRPGSAMPYSDLQSRVSAGDLEGRLYYASDTSRLFALGAQTSDATNFIGGRNVVENSARQHSVDGTTNDTGARNLIWAQESGLETIVNGGASITFDTAYGAIPHVVSSVWTEGGSPNPPTTLYTALSTTGFNTSTRYIPTSGADTTSLPSLGTLMWQSLGTRAI